MLKISNLNVTYNQARPRVPALSDVGLEVSAGENFGIIGESGCGKTTLALAVMGLLKQAAVDGGIVFDGRNLVGMTEKAMAAVRWRRIAIVFQNALEVFNPVITVGEQIGEPLRRHLGLSAREADARAAELLGMTGLDAEWRQGYAHQLSGGMRQRALIAMALACRPEIVIVDEPFTALDPESRRQVRRLLADLQQDLGFTMILISHDLPAVQRLTSRLATLYAGQVVETGRTAEVLRHPMHPYTRGLINASVDFFPYRDLWGIGGEPPAPGTHPGCPFAPRCTQHGAACRQTRPPLRYVAVERRVACHKGGIETVLQARGLTKTFRAGGRTVPALSGVDIAVRSGEVVALVGKSGSGKSTLAHLLINVLAPDGGEVIFQGSPVTGRNASDHPGGMQIVFQDPAEAVSPRLTVLETVREPLDIMGWQDRPARDRKAVAALQSVHLPVSPGFLNRPASALSGGQRQRVAVARALVTDPVLLIADEITAMLDPATQATVLRRLKGLQHENGFCMLFITHDIHLARKVADRVCVLDRGCRVEEGATFEILDRPRHDETRRALEASRGNPGL